MKSLHLPAWMIIVAVVSSFGCRSVPDQSDQSFFPSAKPYTRWWWFATEIKRQDIRYQLDWFQDQNFGGVEIAWVYPLYRYQSMYERNYGRHYPKDTTAQPWLSPEWSDVVAYAKAYADSIGLGCDFTFGSAWPVAGINIDPPHSTQIYGDTSFRQWLTFAWSYPQNQLVINHLDSAAFHQFAQPVAHALKPALQGSKSALFTDSWEIKLNATNKVWTSGFEEAFSQRFGYDIIPYMEAGLDSFPDVRYDYMLMLDEMVTDGFYKPYVETCQQLGAWSRVQCLASPTDVMTTYGLVDIPETEALLNNPSYSRIVSSAASLASKPVVSCEAFTCMYGFPATYLRQEQTADLKMVADALFAQGVNHLVYHGSPYNPQGSDTIDFFATTYFGPGGSLTPELPAFNAYIEQVSSLMQQGRTYSDVAVYIPYEDGVMAGAYPPERQRVWVWGEYELRYVDPPGELQGYHPLWINRHYLDVSQYQSGKLRAGNAQFSLLYVDVKYLDKRALKRILELARQGLPVCLKRRPLQPGKAMSPEYRQWLDDLESLSNVSSELAQLINHPPLLEGDRLPSYWCRMQEDGSCYLFLAQPLASEVKYPVYSGQSFMDRPVTRDLTINYHGRTLKKSVEFQPYQSIMLKISANGDVQNVDISFIPKDPVVRPKEVQKMYF
ncbi:MAG: glycosyl hydrolase [Saprospiraceae bacterium]